MGKRRINCKYCDKFFYDINDYASHIEDKHRDMMIPNMTSRQFIFYLNTGKKHGNCIMCKKPTTWNNVTNKYNRFCDSPKCKEEYTKMFRERMVGKYGQTTLLNDPDQQRIMLSKRKISGKYLWSDRVHEITYTGSYEKSFLIFLDTVMNINPNDIFAPSPHTYYYIYDGKKHFYFPDIYIASLNLEIEIKDGGDNPNTHPKIQAIDKVKEKLKDDVMISNSNTFNYLKITNKDESKFFKYLEEAKYQYDDGKSKKIVML